jgi:hypothetical protein
MHHSTREPHGPRDQKAHREPREPREPNGPEAHRGASRYRETMSATVAHATAFGDGSGFGARVKRASRPVLLTPKELVQLQHDIAWLYSLASSRNEFAMKIAPLNEGTLYVPPRYKKISSEFRYKLESLTAINIEPVELPSNPTDDQKINYDATYDTTQGVPPVQYKATYRSVITKPMPQYTTERRKLLRLFFIFIMLIKANVCTTWKNTQSEQLQALNELIVKNISATFNLKHTLASTLTSDGSIDVRSHVVQLISLANEHMELAEKERRKSKAFEKLHVDVGLKDLFEAYKTVSFARRDRERVHPHLPELEGSVLIRNDTTSHRRSVANHNKQAHTAILPPVLPPVLPPPHDPSVKEHHPGAEAAKVVDGVPSTIANAPRAATKSRVACLRCDCGGIITAEHEDIDDTSDLATYDTIVISVIGTIVASKEDLASWLSENANRALIVVDDATTRRLIPHSLDVLHKMATATEVNMRLWKLKSLPQNAFGIYGTGHSPVGIDTALLPSKPYDPTILVVGQLPADMMMESEPRMVDARSTEVQPELPYCKTIMFASQELLVTTLQKLKSVLGAWIAADTTSRSIIVFVKVNSSNKVRKIASAANVTEVVGALVTMRQNDLLQICTMSLTTGMLVRLGAPPTGEDTTEWTCESPSSKPASSLLDANQNLNQIAEMPAPAPSTSTVAKALAPAVIPAPHANTAAKAPVPASTIAFFKSNKCSRIPDGLLSGGAAHNDGMLGVAGALDIGDYETIIMCDDGGYDPIQTNKLLDELGTWMGKDRSLFVVGGKHDDATQTVPSMQIFNLAQKTRSDITVANVNGEAVFMVARAATIGSNTRADIEWSDVYKYVDTHGCSVGIACANGETTVPEVEKRALGSVIHEAALGTVTCGQYDEQSIVFATGDAEKAQKILELLGPREFRALVCVVVGDENTAVVQHLTAIAKTKNFGLFSARLLTTGHVYVLAEKIYKVPFLKAHLVHTFTQIFAATDADHNESDDDTGGYFYGNGVDVEKIPPCLLAHVNRDRTGGPIVWSEYTKDSRATLILVLSKNIDAASMDDMRRGLSSNGEILVLCGGGKEWVDARGLLANLKPQEGDARAVLRLMRLESTNVISYSTIEHDDAEGSSMSKWYPISEIKLVSETDTRKEFVVQRAPPYTYKITVNAASKMTERIRGAGIRTAMDYIVCVKSNNDAICKPPNQSAEKKGIKTERQITRVQELVYLTVTSTSDPVRIYALAPGAGKTRAMGLALFCTKQNMGQAYKCCVITSDNNRYDQLMNEIMTSMYKGSESIIEHEAGAKDDEWPYDMGTTLMRYTLKDKYDEVTTTLLLSSTGALKNHAVDLSIRTMIDAIGVTFLTLTELRASLASNHDPGYDCIIADECHHVTPLLRNPALAGCKRFVGFSATPFVTDTDATDLFAWANKRRTGASNPLYADVAEFLKSSVVYADGEDVMSILPYAALQYQVHVAHASDLSIMTAAPLASLSIDITEGAARVVTVLPDSMKDFADNAKDFDDAEYDAATEKVLSLISNESHVRSLVYVNCKNALDRLVTKARKSFAVVDSKESHRANGHLAETQKIFVDLDLDAENTTESDFVRTAFNRLNDEEMFPQFKAIFTNKRESIEYYGVPNTYIVGIPNADLCNQARNRAFRVCSHHKEPATGKGRPVHTINYVLVERKWNGESLHRGSFALANAHPARAQTQQSIRGMEGVHRLQLASKKGKIWRIRGNVVQATRAWISQQSDTASRLAVSERFHAYVTNVESANAGAATVLDIAAYMKEHDREICTHDARIRKLIEHIKQQTTYASTSNPATKQPHLFDMAGSGVRSAHHTLRGICFSQKLKLPDAHIAGDLVLDYNPVQVLVDTEETVHVQSVAETIVTKKGALSSPVVYTDVSRVYYVAAHRIQCTGHARFECFRAIGASDKDPTRVFVGTPIEFDAFLLMLSPLAYRTCKVAAATKITPMMIALALRPFLLKGTGCLVTITGGCLYYDQLKTYLLAELNVGEWAGKIEIEIEIERGEPQVHPAKMSIKITGGEQRSININADELEKRDTTLTLAAPPAKVPMGTLYVICTKKPAVSGERKYPPKAIQLPKDIPTIDLRDKNGAFKSTEGDINNVRCVAAVFVVDSQSLTVGDYDWARIVADNYYIVRSST